MSDLIVLAFDSEDGAIEMREAMKHLQKEHIVELKSVLMMTLSKKSAKRAGAFSIIVPTCTQGYSR